MENKMKICVVCKTPIQEGLEIESPVGDVHPGPCLHMLKSDDGSLNESESSVDEIQMIM